MTGGDSVPPSTAPNTLRHWTQEQLDALSKSARGEKLLAVYQKQQEQWRSKYTASGVSSLTWDQFEWAMEVVHSRAFRGDYGLSTVQSIGSAAAPLAALVLGAAYMQNNPDISNIVLAGLAVLATAPLVANTLLGGGSSSGEVVLLPLIDSANHLEQADSSIQYDPVGQVFSLSVGSKCLVKEEGDDSTQLYISYGQKSDAELLLNYGFLPGAASADCGQDDATSDKLRRQLTTEFLSRG